MGDMLSNEPVHSDYNFDPYLNAEFVMGNVSE